MSTRASRFVGTILRGMAARPGEQMWALTLTGPGLDYEAVKAGLREFRRRWRRAYGPIEHHGMCEAGERNGLLHVHLACFVGPQWYDYEAVRPICVAAGFGPRFELKKAYDAPSMARYAAKSLGKYYSKLPVSLRPLTTRGWIPAERRSFDERVMDELAKAEVAQRKYDS